MKAEVFTRDFARAVTAEFTAMFLFIFVGIGCALSTLGIAEGASGQGETAGLTISLCFGFMIFVLAHCFGPISGAHINPAVTLALAINRSVTLPRAFCYVVAQSLGSVAASGVLVAVMGLNMDSMGGYNALSGPEDNRIARGFITELVLTCLLCLTVFATIDPMRRSEGSIDLGPLAIGMAVGVAHFVAVPITGCGINPARSLGPALFANAPAAKDDLWVFIVAPFVGAVVAAVLYPFWFAESTSNTAEMHTAVSPKALSVVPDLESRLSLEQRAAPPGAPGCGDALAAAEVGVLSPDMISVEVAARKRAPGAPGKLGVDSKRCCLW